MIPEFLYFPLKFPYTSIIPGMLKLKKAIITQEKLHNSGCLPSNDAIMEMAN